MADIIHKITGRREGMFSVLGKLSWFFKKYWKRYTSVLLLLLLASILDVLPPKILGVVIDSIGAGTLTSPFLENRIFFLTVIAIIVYIITYIWMRQLFGGANILERISRTKLMNHFLKMSPPFYERNRTGDLMARATNDVKAVAATAGYGILTLIDSTVFMLTVLVMMSVTISWKLTIAAVLPLPIMAFCISKLGTKIHHRFIRAQDAFGKMNDKVLESVEGVRVVRAYVQEEHEIKEFHEMTEEVYNRNREVAQIDALLAPLVKILVGVSYLIGLGYGTYLVFHRELTLGELVSFNVYLGMMIWPMFAIGELINIMERGNASVDRVNQILQQKEDIKNNAILHHVEVPTPIKYKHLSFSYPTSPKPVLSNISFTIYKGETIGIVGRTGSGKTALIQQLLRQYPLGSGELLIGDVPIQHIALERLQSWIGYVPQEHVLFSKTVKENLLLSKETASDEEVEEAIKLAAFDKDIPFLSKGLHTLVGEKGVALSGGQKQRLSIARALLRNPQILILDDSLSAVDAKTEEQIIRNLTKKRKGKTTFIITHRLSAVEHADHILVLEDGRIIQEGTHQELKQREGWYREQHVRQYLKEESEVKG